MVEVSIHNIWREGNPPCGEAIGGYGQAWLSDGDTIYSWETGLTTIQKLGVETNTKDYFGNSTIYNKGLQGNVATVHIYRIDDTTGTINQTTGSIHCIVNFHGE